MRDDCRAALCQVDEFMIAMTSLNAVAKMRILNHQILIQNGNGQECLSLLSCSLLSERQVHGLKRLLNV